MPQFSTKRRVHHAATDMFDLVADVDKYPQFVPLCSALTVKSRAEKDGKTILVADMTVAYKIIRETFTSRVTLERQGLKISGRISQRSIQTNAESLDFLSRRGKNLRR